ncbi:MAG TPA: glycosyl hydrolase family 28-related protein [Sphingobium sp.]|nr:glycosyl hydrolase family 28-related protein [Sphingobium sp.]
MLDATDFGAKFDGVTDDSAALQAAIDAASAQGEALSLPGGVSIINTALNLKGRYVSIYGVSDKTEIRAGSAGMTMFDVEEVNDVLYSPFILSDMIINADFKASFCMRIRYRHHSELNGIFFTNATNANVWEKDTWISRRYNCRSVDAPIGWQLEGSNFDSAFYGCYIAGCTNTQWLINNNGSLFNGNNSLLFSNCGATDATGRGVVVAEGINAQFVACYFGENCDGPTIVNNGGMVVFDGGTISYGWKPTSFMVLPIKGETIFTSAAQINGQDYGSIDRLSHLTPAQIAAGSGTFRFDDAKLFIITGGDQIVEGDPLGFGAQRQVFVPRLGRQFQPATNDVSVSVNSPDPRAKLVTCTGVTGPNPILGLYAPLSLDYRFNERMYLVLVYRSSKPLQARVDAELFGAPVAFLSLPPAAPDTRTHIKLDNPLGPANPGAVFSLLMPNAAPGDFLELYECYLADSTMAAKGLATANRLFKC